MFPPLSDSTKKSIAVCAVLAVALCNVMFGMDWLAERPPARPLAAVTGVAEPPMLASPPVQAARPAVPAAAATPPMKRNAAAPPKIGASQPAAAPKSGAPQPDTAIIIMNEPAAPAAGAPQPLCDVTACAAAYHSFTASDCTYMPSAGVRRLCTKGTPPQ
jgi:BA14K-like protein